MKAINLADSAIVIISIAISNIFAGIRTEIKTISMKRDSTIASGEPNIIMNSLRSLLSLPHETRYLFDEREMCPGFVYFFRFDVTFDSVSLFSIGSVCETSLLPFLFYFRIFLPLLSIAEFDLFLFKLLRSFIFSLSFCFAVSSVSLPVKLLTIQFQISSYNYMVIADGSRFVVKNP